MQPRSERMLDAAIRVLATGGVRALTHRAVDAEAGLPAGSTSNYFRTREALLHAVMAHLVTVERAGWEQLAGSLAPRSADELAEVLAQLIELVTGPARPLSVARYALFAEATRDPRLQLRVTEAARTIAAWGRRWLVDIGSTDPDAHTEIVLAYLDGVILHRLAYPQFQGDVAGRLRTLLRGLTTT